MPSSRLEGKIQTLLMIKMAKIDILFMTEMIAKPYPLGPHIPLHVYSRYKKEVPPPLGITLAVGMD